MSPGNSPAVRIAVWNAEWHSLTSRKGKRIREILEALHPDIVCLTEGFSELLPAQGRVIESDADYGYEPQPGRRKVLLWSRSGWSEDDSVGHPSLPRGRFVSGVTETPAGKLRVIGVCIPWKDAHVRTGKCDRKPWEDHLQYLRGLREILGSTGSPFVVAGDFNQRVPRKRVPEDVHAVLLQTFEGLTEFATAGDVCGIGRQLIDHVAYSAGLSVRSVEGIDRQQVPGGMVLSDHDGVVVELVAHMDGVVH